MILEILNELMLLTILQAEEAAAQSQTVSQEAAKKIDENTTFSLKMVAQVLFFALSDFSSASFTIYKILKGSHRAFLLERIGSVVRI